MITTSVEILAAVVGLFCLNKFKATAAKYLIFFLVYVVVIDFVGGYPKYFKDWNIYYLIDDTLIKKNYWWYIIFWFAGLTSFITLINYKVIHNPNYRKVLKYFFYIYVAQFLLSVIFNFEGLFDPTENFLKIISLWMILVAVILYLLDVLQSKRIIFFYKSIYFYINVSILLWAIITGPMMFYEIYYSSGDSNFIPLKKQIYLTVNISFYLTLSIALLCCKPETK